MEPAVQFEELEEDTESDQDGKTQVGDATDCRKK